MYALNQKIGKPNNLKRNWGQVDQIASTSFLTSDTVTYAWGNRTLYLLIIIHVSYLQNFIQNCFFVLGWFNDLTGSWSVSFYTIGGLQILSSVIIFIERLLWKLKQKTDPVGIVQMKHTKTTENNLLEENIPMMDHNIK